MISKDVIDKVKNLPIDEILKPYVTLTHKGTSLVCCCPFHSERTPSFNVNLKSNRYKCFGCQKTGDGINFVMDFEKVTFNEAVESIAKANGIRIEYVESEKSREQIEASNRRSNLCHINELVCNFFVDQLRKGANSEAESARRYAYNRWGEAFCNESDIGYAPKSGYAFLQYCKVNSISEEHLKALGLISNGKDNKAFAYFRERIMIPIKNRSNQIIAFTGRYIGSDQKVTSKYMNSINSELYVKGNNLFGINKAYRCSDSKYIIVVEGAPDVLRLQSIGMYNVVATLGTAWTDNQFDLLSKIAKDKAVCFIPDKDVVKGADNFGAGIKAVMRNGAEAMRRGFMVTVREPPYGTLTVKVPLFDYEIEEAEALYLQNKIETAKSSSKKNVGLSEITLTDEERQDIPLFRLKYVNIKNDADSHIHSPKDFYDLSELPFVIWLASKRFDCIDSIVEEREAIDEICELLRCIKDRLTIETYIDELGKIHGKAKLWNKALENCKNKALAKSLDKPSVVNEKETELLRKCNLSINDNCYYTYDDKGEPTRLSNFILCPKYHIKDDNNGSRIYQLINTFGDTCLVVFKESDLCSLSAFRQRIGSLGNFLWSSKFEKFTLVQEYTYALTQSADRIRTLGWDEANQLFAYGNGIYINGEFKKVDDMGIVTADDRKAFYLPATSTMFKNNPMIFQFERLMIHESRNNISLHDFAKLLNDVYGDQTKIAVCYLLATLFRDIIISLTRHFPILNLFGEKGSGKTTLANALQSLFIHSVDPPNIGTATIASLNDRISQAVNIIIVFDEYKNDIDTYHIGFLKGLWGGAGQTKKNTNTDGMAAQTFATVGPVLCGQDLPIQDIALFTRLIHLSFNKTVFTQEERDNYDILKGLCNKGMSHLTFDIIKHRDLFKKNFATSYSMTKHELGAKLEGEQIHDRIFGNWVIPLATYRVLETVMDLPFSYAELFDVAIRGIRNQNRYAQESSEVSDFWTTLQGFQTAGRCVEKAHYLIKYVTRFRSLSMQEDAIYSEAKPILFLNGPAIANLVSPRNGGATSNRSNWSTIVSYLKSHPSYLGLKQERFTILMPNGNPDYEISITNGITKKRVKSNRPKALCFDYQMLKDSFSLNLETEVVTEYDDDEPDDSSDMFSVITKPDQQTMF